MNGIKNAIVTLNVSDDSNYVWDDQGADSTGAVSLTLKMCIRDSLKAIS